MFKTKQLHISSWHQYIGLGAIGLIYVGLYTAPSVMSIGMLLLLINLLAFSVHTKSIWTYVKHPLVWCPALFCILYILSGIYSTDAERWVSRVMLKLPLLAIPLGICSIPTYNDKVFITILKTYWWSILLGLVSISVIYLLDMDLYNTLYAQGQVIPTPIMHSRYSIMVAVAIYCGGYINSKLRDSLRNRMIYGIGTVLMVLFLHILAVRTGLVSFYISLLIVMVWYIIRSRHYLWGILGLLVVCGMVASSLLHIPTLRNKLSYTIYSINQIRSGDRIDNLSDAYRIASISAGLHIGNSSPIIGVGMGDVKEETDRYVKQYYPSLRHTVYTPQSQFVLSYAGLGVLGVFALLLLTIVPAFYFRAHYFSLGIFGVFLTMLIVEQVLETQVGMAIYTLVYGVLIRRQVGSQPL